MEKIVAMISGGLDGALAASLIKEQGLDVVGLNITSVFFSGTHKNRKGENQALRIGKILDIPIVVKSIADDYIDIVKKPKYGHGKGINPCIDCKIYFFKMAKKFMEEIGAIGVVTGEVLGQRPMSQQMNSILKIEKDSGLEGKILRPLSALCLNPTEMETAKIIDRNKLFDITGRDRKRQVEMAQKRGLGDIIYGTGGCLLTDKNMKAKMKDLFEHQDKISLENLPRLSLGRHFRLDDGTKFILGRNFLENEFLENDKCENETLISPDDFYGPTALVEANGSNIPIDKIVSILCSFTKKKEKGKGFVNIIDKNGTRKIKANDKVIDFNQYWISNE